MTAARSALQRVLHDELSQRGIHACLPSFTRRLELGQHISIQAYWL